MDCPLELGSRHCPWTSSRARRQSGDGRRAIRWARSAGHCQTLPTHGPKCYCVNGDGGGENPMCRPGWYRTTVSVGNSSVPTARDGADLINVWAMRGPLRGITRSLQTYTSWNTTVARESWREGTNRISGASVLGHQSAFPTF